jgi:surface antigen
MKNTMRARHLMAAMLLPLGLAACANNQDSGLAVGAVAGGLIGNQFGGGSGKVAATIAGAVIGGIVGSEIGRQMDEEDRRFAQQAEYDAFERGQSGQVTHWRNPKNGRYGEVMPSRPYKRNAMDCRDYTHKVYIDGRPEAMRGTACRNPDGTWSSVS